jgi:hypothetical protein
MKLQLPTPGVKHSQEAEFSSKVLRIGRDVLERGGALAQERGVTFLLI